jgi:prephenate dehydrogenase
LNIGIIGLGLMGGSFSKALKKYSICDKVYGYARTPKTIEKILELDLVDRLLPLDELKKECDIIVLAIPVDSIIGLMDDLKDIDDKTTIIDMGSTKEIIVKNIPQEIRKNFVAAHPMTGTEKFGPEAAIDYLYEGKAVVLCDLEENDELHKQRAIDIFQQIGMRIIYMNSKDHDIHACYMSHLPHAISYSLANTVMNHEDPRSIIALAAGGFKDMSRIAKSSPDMWTDIFRQNRNNLLKSIDLFEENMKDVRQMIEKEDYKSLKEWMKKANTLHEIL